jgi:imidazole glycerol phosphate synthase glutamine amidotransferase subunit
MRISSSRSLSLSVGRATKPLKSTMALCKRLIARLDIKGRRLIKGIRFEGLRVFGDPREAALRYAEAGADELLYVDAVASLYGRNGLVDLLRRTSCEVFIPITAGGGVRSVADAAALLAAGADKIAVNTAALQRPELITELAEAFGSQCVVASIQARRMGADVWEAMAEAGRERSGQAALAWMERVQQLGAGEILLTSVDQDGTCAGPDQELQLAAAARSEVPLVMGGGFANSQQVLAALQEPGIAAVCVGAALHRSQLELQTLKCELSATPAHPPIRLLTSSVASSLVSVSKPLEGALIGIIDYGMGNQQSLINAYEYLGATALLSSDHNLLQGCSLLALPGVGAFPLGMAELQRRRLDCLLRQWVDDARPLLGICLGMQMLFDSSEEFGHTAGLGFLRGQVLRLPSQGKDGESVILPHMGWNRLLPGAAWPQTHQKELFNQYFVHTFAATGVNPNSVLFRCRYGDHPFVAAVQEGAVTGVQFHPERSGPDGLALLGQLSAKLLCLT